MSNGNTAATSRGQVVKPEVAQGRTIASSVAELVNSVILQQSATKEGYEKVEWVSLEECDLTDMPLKTSLRNLIGPDTPLVMVLGLANGYQAWLLMSNGECEEFLSVRMGRVKFVKFLPHPEPGYGLNNDAFAQTRPLIATCDSTSAGRPFCSLNITSLKTGDVVHSLRYDEPIGNILCNKRSIVLSFPAKIVVYDAASITELFYIKVDHTSEKLDAVPVALGSSWLAYSDTKLNGTLQSCGGVSLNEASVSYTSQMMNVAKNLSKTVTTFSESVATSITGSKSGSRSKASKSNAQAVENLSIVTIIDIKNFPTTQTSIHASADAATGVVAHFVANIEERVAALEFNNNSSLLLVCGSSGQQFNLFSILPHPSSPVLGAVHHLYTLHRGSTNAKIQDVCFDEDSRWVAVTTANGTTHIFPVTPYGGAVSVRTHGSGRVANKESRFFRSAGLDGLETMGPPSPPRLSSSPVATKASPIAKDSHPSLNAHHMALSRVVSNPRLPPYPTPTVVIALAKIKQQFGGALGNLAPTQETAPTKKHGANASTGDEQQRISTIFASLRGLKTLNPAQKFDDTSVVLYVLNYYGEMVEYVFNVKKAGSVSKNSADAPIELIATPGAQWQIGRQKRNQDLLPPLGGQHPLMIASEIAKTFYADTCRSVHRGQNYAVYQDAGDNRSQKNANDVSWISEVEMVTYSGPHRRLWMGPQFTFKTYVDHQYSASLVSPGDRSRRFDRSEPMAVPGRVPLRSIPVLIEAGSVGSIDQMPGPTVEICGSWSDNDYISCDEQEGRLRESIADAMQDQTSFGQHGPGRPSGGSSEELSSVGSENARYSDSVGFNHSPSRESQLQFAAGYIDP